METQKELTKTKVEIWSDDKKVVVMITPIKTMWWNEWLEVKKRLEQKGYQIADLGYCNDVLCVSGTDVIYVKGDIQLYKVLRGDGPDVYCYWIAVAPQYETGWVLTIYRNHICGPNGYTKTNVVMYYFNGTSVERRIV